MRRYIVSIELNSVPRTGAIHNGLSETKSIIFTFSIELNCWHWRSCRNIQIEDWKMHKNWDNSVTHRMRHSYISVERNDFLRKNANESRIKLTNCRWPKFWKTRPSKAIGIVLTKGMIAVWSTFCFSSLQAVVAFCWIWFSRLRY